MGAIGKKTHISCVTRVHGFRGSVGSRACASPSEARPRLTANGKCEFEPAGSVYMNSSTINRSYSPPRPKGVVLRLIAVIFFALPVLAHAAEISGTVLDSSNAV